MTDAIDLSKAIVHSSPGDVASWPITETITGLVMQPSGDGAPGLAFTFQPDLPVTWEFHPNPASPSDNYQYTVWAGVQTPDGVWHIAAFIEMWQGRPSTGAPILTDFAKNWAYDPVRWGPMAGHQPVAGDPMVFFVSAGDARGQGAPTSVRERSNVVLVNLPAGDSGLFTFTPPPAVQPPAVQQPDLNAKLDALTALVQQLLNKPAPNYVGDTSLPWLGKVTVVLKPR